MAKDAEFDAQVNKRRRKLAGRETHTLNVVIGMDFYEQLKALAGDRAMGYAVERLIYNAMRRRMKRANTTYCDNSADSTLRGDAGVKH